MYIHQPEFARKKNKKGKRKKMKERKVRDQLDLLAYYMAEERKTDVALRYALCDQSRYTSPTLRHIWLSLSPFDFLRLDLFSRKVVSCMATLVPPTSASPSKYIGRGYPRISQFFFFFSLSPTTTTRCTSFTQSSDKCVWYINQLKSSTGIATP